MSQQNSESVRESTPVEPEEVMLEAACEAHASRGRSRPVVEDFEPQPDRVAVSKKLDELGQFVRMAHEGREPLAAVMSFMVADRAYQTLEIIVRGNNNYQKIACALALIFHTAKDIPLRVQKARGYDRLRNLVTTCVTRIRRHHNAAWQENEIRLIDPLDAYPDGYLRLIEKLFTSHGHPAP